MIYIVIVVPDYIRDIIVIYQENTLRRVVVILKIISEVIFCAQLFQDGHIALWNFAAIETSGRESIDAFIKNTGLY